VDAACFEGFQRIARERAGIHLRSGKAVLVASRLGPRLRELGLATEREYLELLRAAPDDRELVRFLDAISTNFTKFYREADHFDLLAADVAHAKGAGQRRFRFWSAGCSSGEEPYTLAMVLDPLLGGCDWKILATDLSTAVLARAAAGVYGDEEIATIPAQQRGRHLVRVGEGRWQMQRGLRERIVFRRMNLAERPFPMKGPLDAVLCRNVMIYFDLPMRERLVAEIERLLAPGAPLLIGHAETLSGIRTGLRTHGPSVYRRPPEEPCP
jgi:chemotaxis protein methyltransferase CheR